VADYSVAFARSARKELEKLPRSVVERVFVRIEELAGTPRPPGAIKLQGNKDLWRLARRGLPRDLGIDDAARLIDISAVRHRRDVYRDL